MAEHRDKWPEELRDILNGQSAPENLPAPTDTALRAIGLAENAKKIILKPAEIPKVAGWIAGKIEYRSGTVLGAVDEVNVDAVKAIVGCQAVTDRAFATLGSWGATQLAQFTELSLAKTPKDRILKDAGPLIRDVLSAKGQWAANAVGAAELPKLPGLVEKSWCDAAAGAIASYRDGARTRDRGGGGSRRHHSGDRQYPA
jgi:hypothetical protein